VSGLPGPVSPPVGLNEKQSTSLGLADCHEQWNFNVAICVW
jgi:hypothetical protein